MACGLGCFSRQGRSNSTSVEYDLAANRRLQNLQLQVQLQNKEMKRQTNAYKKALVGKAKKLIKSERTRNLKLWEDNKRLRMKLKELESKKNFG